MNPIIPTILLFTASTGIGFAKGPAPHELTEAIKAEIGSQGIAWYTTWETAKKEAKRSNRPIFFFAAAHQCGSISGTF